MDLTQRKLSQEEWESLEVPIQGQELQIIRMVKEGFNDVAISSNDTQTLLNFIKLTAKDNTMYHYYLYDAYFKKDFDKLMKKYNIKCSKEKRKKHKKLKKADLIRINNTDKKIAEIKDCIFEFVLLRILEDLLKSSSKNKYYYTLVHLLKYSISNINIVLKDQIQDILKRFKAHASKREFIAKAYDYIERNEDLVKYKDIKLYTHQKDLFTHCKPKGPKFIMYQAPTGTGKTLSPLGLSQGYKIIFVCAAKHVGLQLAKACISLDIKIAVAFGCKDPGNIRLHWSAAKESVRNRRTGGIFKVDNSVGDYVQVMISDIQSYLPAMHYMKAFNDVEDMILYWDEPTITLDYEDHPYHAVMAKNWQDNEIPNIVLSSATLPPVDQIRNMTRSFITKFNSTNIINLISHDCTKTIPLIDTKGYAVLPHLYFQTQEEIKACLKHLKSYKTLLRHFDVKEIVRFIIYVNDNVEIKDRYKLDNYFETVSSIDILSIKNYYLTLLGSLKDKYEQVYNYFQAHRSQVYKSYIRVTTSDAHTLTDGPTIYLADDVEKIGQYCLKTANIPSVMFDAIAEDIGSNEKIRIEIDEITKEINKNKDKGETVQKTDKKGKSRSDKSEREKRDPKEERQIERCEFLRTQIKRIRLGLDFIPNSKEHKAIWNATDVTNAFCSSIEDNVVEKIMLLDVTPNWKFLLLMGIGVFAQHTCDDYVAIMKDLALKQKLYLIIASTDYIYGTNYQFCHGYIGKDLEGISQEKLIQACGRAGRSSLRQDYSLRLRSNKLINTLFTKSENKVEVNNMNKLFV